MKVKISVIVALAAIYLYYIRDNFNQGEFKFTSYGYST